MLMGVCGCGKTTVGELLASELGWTYHDGDDHHPEANVAKMAAGVPLDDTDREPWLRTLADLIGGWLEQGEGAILGCSALKEKYRQILGTDRPGVCLVYLRGSPELIGGRLLERTHRYMPASLLESQFAALEEPRGGVAVDVDGTPADVVDRICRHLEETACT